MPGTLSVTHKAIGAEVRRYPYDVELDGEVVGSVAMNDTFEAPLTEGPHSVRVRNGRRCSAVETFDVSDGVVVRFRCTGKRFLPLFLASFVDPKLALVLVRT